MTSTLVLAQVFGTTGVRTLKELLAEAETPTKRSLSARTGGPSAADAFAAGSPRPGGTAEQQQQQQQQVPRGLRPLAAALAASGGATAASNALVDRCSSVLQRVPTLRSSLFFVI